MAPPVSLFRRVNRFIATDQTNPRENRLTEAFAAVIDRVDDELAYELALTWLDVDAPGDPREQCAKVDSGVLERLRSHPHWDVEVATQVPRFDPDADRNTLRYVDLELRFTAHDRTPRDQVCVRVEIKHGTDLHDQQLRAYRAGPGEWGAVVLLAPGASLRGFDPNEIPDDVPQRCWEQVGQRCARCAAASSKPVDRWLLDEFVDYLREEGPMTPESLGPEHLIALAYNAQAETALEVVCQQADAYVMDEGWVPSRPPGPVDYGVPYHSPRYHHPPPSRSIPGQTGAWLDWAVTRASPNHHFLTADRAVFFMAGLNVEQRREFELTDAQRVRLEAMQLHRFTGDSERFHRAAYPHEVLTGSTLAEQGTALGRWIAETFELIYHPSELDADA